MYCKDCGCLIQANERYCPKCGALNIKANAKPASDGPKKATPVLAKPSTTSVPQRQPQPPVAAATQRKPQPAVAVATQRKPQPPVTSVTQGQPQPSATSVTPKNEKKKKKKPSGCLKAFLIVLAIGLVLGLIGVFLLGKILPGGSVGNSDNQQIQAEYIEPEASTPLRKSLGGTYTPDEKDFRFDDNDSISGYVDHVILVFFKSGVSDKEVQRVASLVNGELIGCIDAIDCFELRVPESGSEALEKVCETLLREKSVIRACTDSVDPSTSIEWCDPYLENVIPNDSWGEWTWVPQEIRNVFLQQWSMLFPRGKNWHQELIGAPSAWAYSDYYSPVSVGVIDGGFDTEHSDLQITLVNPFSNSQTLKDKNMAGKYNHGTHVAGIIGATRGNGKGVNGILSGPYSLYGFCFDFKKENERQKDPQNTQSQSLTACAMLLNQECRVINRSIGLKWKNVKDDQGVIRDYINPKNNRPINMDTGVEHTDEYWKEEGVKAAKDVLILLRAFGDKFLIVNAAGNDCIDAKYAGWVCSVTEDCAKLAVKEMSETRYTADDIMNAIIVVGAVANNENYGNFSSSDSGEVLCDRHLELTNFSNYGKQVTICAPGDDIYSTVRNDYDFMPGTSMAAPIVAACAAQVWSVDLNQTAGEVKAKLVSTALSGVETVSESDSKGRTYSMVNLKDAVESVLLEKGLITETRPDGDLRRLVDEYVGERFEEENEELENLSEHFATELTNSNFSAAFDTLCEMLYTWLQMVFYALVYLLAEIVLPGGSLNDLMQTQI